jgi:hypothetical protein
MIDWIDGNYDIDTVYLVRHPIPQALSCIRNGWATTTGAYLRNDWFVATMLGDGGLDAYARSLDRTGTDLERFVLNWVLENLYPLRVLAQRPQWLSLSYEECVTDQSRVLTEVCRRLSLDDMARMRRAAARASRSSSMSGPSAVSAIKGGDSEELVSGWRANVSADDVSRVARILDRFGVTLYSASSPVPDWTGYRAGS